MSRLALYRFEAIAELYYQRYHRLAPGKSEPIETGRDSNEEFNRLQFAAWHSSGEAFSDAIDRIIELNNRIGELHNALEDANARAER